MNVKHLRSDALRTVLGLLDLPDATTFLDLGLPIQFSGWFPVHIVDGPDGVLIRGLKCRDLVIQAVTLDTDFSQGAGAGALMQLVANMSTLRSLSLCHRLPRNWRSPGAELTMAATPNLGGQLNALTHLELTNFENPSGALKGLSQLTHLKLTVSQSRLGYNHFQVLPCIRDAKSLPIIGFELGLQTSFSSPASEIDLRIILHECVNNWPNLETLNLISEFEGEGLLTGDPNGATSNLPLMCAEELHRSFLQRVRMFHAEGLQAFEPEEFDRLSAPIDNLDDCRADLLGTRTLHLVKLKQLSLGIIASESMHAIPPFPRKEVLEARLEDTGSLPWLSTLFRAAWPTLQVLRFIVPSAGTNKYGIARAVCNYEAKQWVCRKEETGKRSFEIFGTTSGAV